MSHGPCCTSLFPVTETPRCFKIWAQRSFGYTDILVHIFKVGVTEQRSFLSPLPCPTSPRSTPSVGPGKVSRATFVKLLFWVILCGPKHFRLQEETSLIVNPKEQRAFRTRSRVPGGKERKSHRQRDGQKESHQVPDVRTGDTLAKFFTERSFSLLRTFIRGTRQAAACAPTLGLS